MKITDCLTVSIPEYAKIICPSCHCSDCRKHGVYFRKGFHRRDISVMIMERVLRYLCLNADCPRCTFSILPPMVLPYCRFFWPDLLAIKQALTFEAARNHLAQQWHVGRRVIMRTVALLNLLNTWVGELYQEVTDGGQARALGFMVKIVTRKLGRIEPAYRWYRHRYPLRFSNKSEHHTIQLFSVNT